ncbi:unnamed protein product [Parascedosporium putredinis]|uniref:DNA repair protein REV1 n=1 Tax=Parascedosporium putredinis TaxID=1442378 RepID=A0A9P1H614_9PEZI|nr:unnamed protein product [Parascedosporium putredinis]CAI7998272.1 unnamed protein product [Parascedosporium putredinis]
MFTLSVNLDAQLRNSSSDLPQIFKGVVAHVSGYTQPPLHVLHKELVKHGAAFLQYLDSKTMATHIIASSLTPKKAVEFARYRIVKPAWVTDSIKAGKLLPWSDYRVVDEGPRQKVLRFDGSNIISQNNSQRKTGYREQTQNSFYNSQFEKILPRSNGTPRSALPSEAAKAGENQSLADAEQLKTLTSEEYNAWLLTDPHIRKSSSANPNFLAQFYSESRLHHLSTWKAELKSKMQRMANERGTGPKSVKRAPGSRRYVIHVDFDSFFCAVSLKKHPEYAEKPVVVAHGSGTGSEIASCNYPARSHGVKNGMWMKRALELCPTLKVLPYDFPAYEDASQQFYEAILDVGGVVQSVSIDEALIDITAIVMRNCVSSGKGVDEGSLWREQDAADQIATKLRAQVKESTGCAVSVGIGANILLAKVALRKAKPNGQYQIRPEETLSLLASKLEELGVKYVKDLRATSKERLTAFLGPKTGERLWEYARGINKAEPRGSLHPALARARYYESDPKAKTPLNVSGTQFILPSNPDPEVVAQLPLDIRSRLMGQGSKSPSASQQNSPSVKPKQPVQPAAPDLGEPLPSQIDPEVFNALPDDMKAEVLLAYRRPEPAAGPSRSPHPIRTATPEETSDTDKKGGRLGWGKTAERQRDTQAGLMQTNFMGREDPVPNAAESDSEELDPDILAELPEDVRKEVLEDHRRRRLARKSGLNVNRPNRRPNTETEHPPRDRQAKIAFPPPPPKMTFGSSGITSAQGVKDMLDAWHAKTSASGPHRADVQMLEKYLCQVVVEERNMEKAISIVKYLDWILQEDETDGKAKQAWVKASASVKEAVQAAARQRGLRG